MIQMKPRPTFFFALFVLHSSPPCFCTLCSFCFLSFPPSLPPFSPKRNPPSLRSSSHHRHHHHHPPPFVVFVSFKRNCSTCVVPHT
ncbi:hypothetical protein BDB00DRAFT_472267 [Zychaea mexicana]|uniref:uncharacterized protein n=1 Tax=Zychaea mexicana TaxID=64656 RepID=UPI0022FEE92C|nr:uncharacterized protein BDB00DRAFT_472267 [Zychaea mexicana]KAI9491773.1 hypothetical protein BDB00DRAFT_472267 [Zychaea mexicana]